jgi:antitoxin MazE
MQAVLKARIIKIGNSHGIRIPKLVLDQVGLEHDVEIAVEADRLIVRRLPQVRVGWEAQFIAMAAAGDDQLLDDVQVGVSSWDAEEWTW